MAGIVHGQDIIDLSIPAGKIEADAITTAKLADANVTTAKIALDAIDGSLVADDAIDSEHLAAGGIDTEHFAAGAVDAAALGADAVTTAKILNANVTTAKIALDAIDGSLVADDAIDSEHLAAGAIDSEHFAAGAVDTTALGANSVTTAKIALDAIDGSLVADDAIGSEHLAAGAVDTTALGADAVTGDKVADDAIGSEHLAAGAVDTTALGADAVTGDKVADDAIDSEHLAAGGIDTEHLADLAVTDAKIAGMSASKLSGSFEGAASLTAFLRELVLMGGDLPSQGAVYDDGSGGLEATASGADMNIDVAAGEGFNGLGEMCRLSATGEVTLDAADVTNPRYDLIYLDTDDSVKAAKGTAGADPSPPALPAGGLSLALVEVKANDTAIPDAQVYDHRLFVNKTSRQDTASGDGSTTDFTLSKRVEVAEDVAVFNGGIRRISDSAPANENEYELVGSESADYQSDGSVIRFGAAPTNGNSLIFFYRA